MRKKLHLCIQLCFLMFITLILVKGCYSNTYQIKGLTKARLSTSECKSTKDPLGASCIPLQPQRIIALDQTMMEALLAVDLEPIAATQPNMAGSIIPKFGQKAEGIVS
ncbi:hypothetical protein [Trichormus azollae]|uniref:hypothetical protein n=1 Tax=Trichormus azollae TaxID=1164 RepID=UPI00325F65C2